MRTKKIHILIFSLLIITIVNSCYSRKKTGELVNSENILHGDISGIDTLLKLQINDSTVIFEGEFFRLFLKNDFYVLIYQRGHIPTYWYSWGRLIEGEPNFHSPFLSNKEDLMSLMDILKINGSEPLFVMDDNCFDVKVNSEFCVIYYKTENILTINSQPLNSDLTLKNSFSKKYERFSNIKSDTLSSLLSNGFISSIDLTKDNKSYFSVSNGWYTVLYMGDFSNESISKGDFIDKSEFQLDKMKLDKVQLELNFIIED